MIKDKKLLFLTGIGRSGTTLLQNILHSHSEINFQPETHFFKSYLFPLMINEKTSSEKILQKQIDDDYLKRLKADERALLIESEKNFKGLKESFIEVLCSGESSFGADKDTEYVRYIPHLKKAFPDAFLLNIIRDPRDVVLSRTKTSWGSKRSPVFHASEYVHYCKRIKDEGPKYFGSKYYEVKYEDLISNPEKVLKSICSWLKIRYDKTMLTDYTSNQDLISNDEREWKGNVTSPVNKDNRNKWKKELKSDVVGVLEKNLKEFFLENNYEFSNYSVKLTTEIFFNIYLAAFRYKTWKERIND